MDGADLPHPLLEEIVALGNGRELSLLRAPDPDALIDEDAFEHEERLPYWAELWPSGVALARALSARALKGARVLELGCGLGTASVAAALAGGRVLATDWAQEALALTRTNAERNGAVLETLRVDWNHPAGLVQRGPWDLVLAADVLYERRSIPVLLDLLPRLKAAEVWLADPGRALLGLFLEEAGARFEIEERGAIRHLTPRVS